MSFKLGGNTDKSTATDKPADTDAAKQVAESAGKEALDSTKTMIDQDHDQNVDKLAGTIDEQAAALTATNQADAKQPISAAQILAESQAATQGGTMDAEAVFSSHPIQNFSLGRFQFENTLLRLHSAEDVAEFRKLRDKLPIYEQNVVKEIRSDVVDEIVEQRIASMRANVTQNFDSSVGRAAMERLRSQVPAVGTESVENLNRDSKPE